MPETRNILHHVFLKVQKNGEAIRGETHLNLLQVANFSSSAAASLAVSRETLPWVSAPGCLGRRDGRMRPHGRQSQSSCWTSTTFTCWRSHTAGIEKHVRDATWSRASRKSQSPTRDSANCPKVTGRVWARAVPSPAVNPPHFFTSALTFRLRLGQIPLALPQPRALAQRVPLDAECPGGAGDSPAPARAAGAVRGTAGLPTAPPGLRGAPGRWFGGVAAAGPRGGTAGAGTWICPCPGCPRGPGQRWDAGPVRAWRRALAASVSAAEHVPGRRGQGRCSEARGTFPTAPPPGEPVARRGAAARRSPRLPGGEAARPPCSEAG